MRSPVRTQILLAALGLLAACGPYRGEPPSAPTAAPPAVPTATPYPTYTLYPTADLSGLYCEYDFCIGHPPEIPFFDLEVANQALTERSSYAQGNLIGFDHQLYLFLIWSQLPGEFDPAAMIDRVLLDDSAQSTTFSESLGGRTVTYVALASTPSPDVLPHGLAAAWRCADRAFGWKAYVHQEDQASDLLHQALARFACSPGN
jgi:hypothetical protein